MPELEPELIFENPGSFKDFHERNDTPSDRGEALVEYSHLLAGFREGVLRQQAIDITTAEQVVNDQAA